MIKFFLTIYKDGDKNGKNYIYLTKEKAIEQKDSAIQRKYLKPGDKVSLNYADFDEEGNLKGGVFYPMEFWEL